MRSDTIRNARIGIHCVQINIYGIIHARFPNYGCYANVQCTILYIVTTAVDRQLLCRNVYMQVLHTPRYTDVLIDWLAYTRRDGSLTYSGPHYGRGVLEQ